MKFIVNHSEDKKDNSSVIFKSVIANKAKAADNSVINATIGMLYDDDEKFFTFDTVRKVDSTLTDLQKYPYTNSVGIKPYCDAVLNWVFDKHLAYFTEHEYVSVIATPGGSGAISNAFSNYLNPKENVLLPDYMWTNYIQMAYENYLGYKTYKMFDNNGKFALGELKNTFDDILKSQDRILFVINDPCHNPTGYSLSREEWNGFIDTVNSVATKEHPFILFYDMAYVDYAKNGREFTRETIYNFKNFNENVLVVLGFSGSKTLGLYGLRIGAMIGLSKTKEGIEDFNNSCQYSARSKYSMCSTYGMHLIAKVLGEEPYRSEFVAELNTASSMLAHKAELFINEANKIGLKTLPFDCGFFITIPCKNDELVYDELVKRKLHVAPIGNAIRVAICSVSTEHAKKIPGLIKEVLDLVE